MRRWVSHYLGIPISRAAAIVVTACIVASCGGSSSDADASRLSPAARAAAIGDALTVRVAIDVNDAAATGTNCADLGADWASCARGRLILENGGARKLAAGGWTLYVHSIRRLLMIEHPAIAWKHITGDLYALTPAAGAFTLGSGERLEVPFVGEYWYRRTSDLLPRAYVVADGDTGSAVLRNNDTDDETRYVDRLPAVADNVSAFVTTPTQVLRARAEAALPDARQVAARAYSDWNATVFQYVIRTLRTVSPIAW